MRDKNIYTHSQRQKKKDYKLHYEIHYIAYFIDIKFGYTEINMIYYSNSGEKEREREREVHIRGQKKVS